MKILYLSMAFNKQGDNLYNNLVDSLLNRGHLVTIVKSNTQEDFIDVISNNYKILNVKTGNTFEANLIKKGINQIRLQSYFKKAIKRKLKEDHFDLILYATPPITLYGVIKYCKEKYKATTFLMLKDIFPQNAVDLNMFSKKSFLYKYFRNQEKKYYEISDFIGCMSQGNIDYLLKHNPEIRKDKVNIFYNSIKVNCDLNTEFNTDKTVFIFGGNLGKPQNIPFLLEVIKKLSDYPKAYFKIIGKGTEQTIINKFKNKYLLNNLQYIEYLPSNEYEEILKKADVGLISLDARFTIPNIPSKFQFYLRQKKPVLAITDTNTDIKDMILNSDCGWWIEAHDADKVINLIKSICEKKEDQINKGKNGFKYFINEFDVEKNVDIIEKFYGEKIK